MIILKDGENAKIEVRKVSIKLVNYFLFWIFKFLGIFSFLLTFCQDKKNLSSVQTMIFPQGTLCSEGAASTAKGNEYRVLPSGFVADQGLPRGAFSPQDVSLFPALA